jgi:DNA-directed RNA polymerase
MTPDQMTRQESLESYAVEWGKERFEDRLLKARTKGEFATVGAAASGVRQSLQPMELMVCAVDEYLAAATKKRGAKHVMVTYAKMLPADVVAYITARTVFNGVLADTLVPKLARVLANRLLDEIRYRRLQEKAPQLFDYKMESFDTSDYNHRKRSLDQALRDATVRGEDGTETQIDCSDLDLKVSQEIALGVGLINLFVETTGLFHAERRKHLRRGKMREERVLVATEETLKWLSESNQALALTFPIALPMVTPPLPWGPNQRGGYRFKLRGRYPMVRGVSNAQRRVLNESPMPVVYDAVNAIQNTAWKINPDVLHLVEAIIARRGGMGGIPELGEKDRPTKPREIPEFEGLLKEHRREQRKEAKLGRRKRRAEADTVLPSDVLSYAEEWRRWRKAAAAVEDENYQRLLSRTEWAKRLLRVLDLIKDEERLYFPMNLDFRGRIYAIPNFIHPQGDDRAKALLTFACGRPLGSEGTRYLAQHGANTLDVTPDGRKVSRMPIAERVQWIEEHSTQICQAAEDPFTHQWWNEAGDKLQFFAFCCEWKRLCDHRVAGQPDDTFVSALPVALDGTNNGLQHFGAMLLDADCGRAVNLVPGALPADVYSDVMDLAVQQIVADAANPKLVQGTVKTVKKAGADGKKTSVEIQQPALARLAELWIASGLIKRSLVKRPVMTFPYGSREFGFAAQLRESLESQGENVAESRKLWEQTKRLFSSPDGLARALAQGDTKAPGDLVKPACAYLASKIMQALQGVVVKAASAMQWMQAGARLVAGEGKCVEWTVPSTGFKVKQEYFDTRVRRVDTVLCGTVYKPAFHENTEDPAAYRQANAVSPNVVHSLDAAALMLTVRAAGQDGVESFAMIHDSYGAPAGDCAVLARATRQSFVRLYRDTDVIGAIHRAFLAQVPAEVAEKLPEPPSKGTLDLGAVLESEFFFA